jgi:hypothetical protein
MLYDDISKTNEHNIANASKAKIVLDEIPKPIAPVNTDHMNDAAGYDDDAMIFRNVMIDVPLLMPEVLILSDNHSAIKLDVATHNIVISLKPHAGFITMPGMLSNTKHNPML